MSPRPAAADSVAEKEPSAGTNEKLEASSANSLNEVNGSSVGLTEKKDGKSNNSNSNDTNDPEPDHPSSGKAEDPAISRPATKPVIHESFEIEMGGETVDASMLLPASHSRDEDEELNDDMKGLLSPKQSSKKSSDKALDQPSSCCCCGPSEHIGNLTIFWSSRYVRTGWGIRGPHWFGPPVVVLLLTSISTQLIRSSFHRERPVTAFICLLFYCQCVYFLIQASYRDPGVVRQKIDQDDQVPRDYRWCDTCQNYQPPKGVHCPDCNVCVDGFDHHCVWMGTCIGRGNYVPFVRFNLSWMVYLSYALLWVGIAVPLLNHGHGHHQP